MGSGSCWSMLVRISESNTSMSYVTNYLVVDVDLLIINRKSKIILIIKVVHSIFFKKTPDPPVAYVS